MLTSRIVKLIAGKVLYAAVCLLAAVLLVVAGYAHKVVGLVKETEQGVTIGIRADGDTTHSAGNYQYLVIVPAGQTSETPAQITASVAKALPPGNYWAALDQTDSLGGSPATSAWTAEVPFSIPTVAPATPASPADFIPS